MSFPRTRILIIILILTFAFNLLQAFDTTDDEQSEDDPIEKRIESLKKELMPCRRLLDHMTLPLFQKSDILSVDHGLRQCEDYYTQLIDKILDDLGLIGRAIRRWLESLATFAILMPHIFMNAGVQSVADPSVYRFLDPLKHRHLLAPEESYYLEAAFLYGLGICTHLEVGPLADVLSELHNFWRYSAMLDEEFGKGIHEFTYLEELKNRLRMNGQVHTFILMRKLTQICTTLSSRPMASDLKEIHRIQGLQEFIYQVRHDWYYLDDYDDGITRSAIRDILEPPREGICNQGDFYRFKKGLKFIYTLIDNYPDDTLVKITTREMASIFVETCHSRLMPHLQYTNLIPHDLETYVFSTMVRERLNNLFTAHLEFEHLIGNQLETRSYSITSSAERLFFEIPPKCKLIDAKESEAAYLDGRSGPCQFYYNYRAIYNEKTPLFELIELFTFLNTLNMVWHPISNEATGFYFMFTLCRQNRLPELQHPLE